MPTLSPLSPSRQNELGLIRRSFPVHAVRQPCPLHERTPEPTMDARGRSIIVFSSLACVTAGYFAFSRDRPSNPIVVDALFILSMGVCLVSSVVFLLKLASASISRDARSQDPEAPPRIHRTTAAGTDAERSEIKPPEIRTPPTDRRTQARLGAGRSTRR